MKKIIGILLATALTFSFVACGGNTDANTPEAAAPATDTGTAGTDAPAASNANAIPVKYSVVFAATGVQADGAAELGTFINEYSEGRMNMEFYPSSQLGDKVATFEGLQLGTIEMSDIAATDLSSFNQMWSVFALPYLWENGAQAVNTVTDPAVSEVLNADAAANGFKIIAWYDIGSRSIMNSRGLTTTPADMSGLKLRTLEDPILAGSVNAMGGIATPMAYSEVFTAIQQGTIDGLDHTPASLYDASFHEVAKYLTMTEHFTIPGLILVSNTWFEGLSEENQEAILQAGAAWAEKWNTEIWPQADSVAVEALLEEGVEIAEIDKTPFIEATQSVVDDFLADATEEQVALYELLVSTRDKY